MSPKSNTKKDPPMPILVIEDIYVHKDAYSYVVTEKTGAATSDVHTKKYKPTYHPSLSSAIKEVSLRLFNRKLGKRAEAEQYDFESLLRLIEEHNAEIEKRFEIS